MEKNDFYKRIKIAGMVSYIPIALSAGPMGGYFIGDYLEKRFGLGSYVSFIGIGIGFVAGIREAARIILLVIKIEKNK